MMFDDVNWSKIINDILSYVGEDWKFLTIKAVISRTSYSTKFYYSKKDDEFVNLYDVVDREKVFALNNVTLPEFKKITGKFNDHKEKLFLTIKVADTGNVRVTYRDIKEGHRLPEDESRKYLKLNEGNKIAQQ